MPEKNVRGVNPAIRVFAETERLLLRQWQPSDEAPYCRMNADQEVMAFFPATLTHPESSAHIGRMSLQIAETGYGLFAVERKSDHAFIGFTGLSIPSFDCFFTPCIE